jgi:transposase
MAKLLVDDELWAEVEPLLPKPKPRRFRNPGRKPVDNRKALVGIIFVLKSGIPWEMVPGELGVCGMVCWKKLHEWQEAGVWDRLVEVLVKKLDDAHKIDWNRGAIDSSSIRAVYGGDKTGPSPVDRAKSGSKHHVLTEGHGIPLAAEVTAANVNDITELKPLVEHIPCVRDPKSGRVKHLRQLFGDRAYDSEPHRQWLRKKEIEPKLARRGTSHGSHLGIYRWVAERVHAWLHQMRRLRTRFERRGDIHQAFLTLGSALICQHFLNK